MKERFLDGMARILGVLERYDIEPGDRDTIVEEYKDICYQWARTNAISKTFEDNLLKAEGQDALFKYFSPMRDMDAVQQNLEACFPMEWIWGDYDDD